jgi:hypothetical protein
MDQRFRRGFTAAEKTELWDRWQRSESLKAIGRAFGKPYGRKRSDQSTAKHLASRGAVHMWGMSAQSSFLEPTKRDWRWLGAGTQLLACAYARFPIRDPSVKRTEKHHGICRRAHFVRRQP